MLSSDEAIRLVHIEEGRTIGEKRNFGCELAAGEIIAHWDDDDWSAPGRVADQVSRLQETCKAVTGYRSMLFTDGRTWWRFEAGPAFAVGTSLCYYRSWWKDHPFRAMQVGEDGEFVNQAAQRSQLVSVPGGEMMVASVHPGNTSPRQLNHHQYKVLSDFAGLPGVKVA